MCAMEACRLLAALCGALHCGCSAPWSVYKFVAFQGLTAILLSAFAIMFEKGGAPPPPVILPRLGLLPYVPFPPRGKVELTPYWPHVRQCKTL